MGANTSATRELTWTSNLKGQTSPPPRHVSCDSGCTSTITFFRGGGTSDTHTEYAPKFCSRLCVSPPNPTQTRQCPEKSGAQRLYYYLSKLGASTSEDISNTCSPGTRTKRITHRANAQTRTARREGATMPHSPRKARPRSTTSAPQLVGRVLLHVGAPSRRASLKVPHRIHIQSTRTHRCVQKLIHHC